MEYRVNWGGGALYDAYAADVNLDSSALKDDAVDYHHMGRKRVPVSYGSNWLYIVIIIISVA